MILSAQSIRKYCLSKTYTTGINTEKENPLISPFVERGVIRGKSFGLSACTYDCRISHHLTIAPRQSKLAVTLEQFNFPNNICGSVLDKSSWARLFVSAFNTHLDPGWKGFLTLELANLSDGIIWILEGDPICQIKFEYLDFPTELPYQGKYQNQTQTPTPMINEE